MDLGIRGRRAIALASSRGLGRACAAALAREGAEVVVNGRTEADVLATATELAHQHQVEVTPVTADLTAAEGRDAILAACVEPDILVINGAGPPAGPFGRWDESRWEETLHDAMVAPLLLVRDVIRGMRARKYGRIVTITSALVKTPEPFMTLSTGARTGLTAVLKALQKDAVRDNVTINQILPKHIDTERQVQMAHAIMEARGITWEEARAEQVESIAAKRMGTADEVADVCAFLCSAQAGYISGQNLMVDGGSYEGLI
jgi:3-oxoacyl-[acyl-carrier protein] reductase